MRLFLVLLTALLLVSVAAKADDVLGPASLGASIACGNSAMQCQPHVIESRAWSAIQDWQSVNVSIAGPLIRVTCIGGNQPVLFSDTYRRGSSWATAATSGSAAGCTTVANGPQTRASYQPVVIFNMKATTATNQRIWLTLASSSLDQVGGAAVAASTTTFVGVLMDFGYSLNIQVCSGDGVAGSCVDTGVAYTTGLNYKVQLDLSLPGRLVTTIWTTSYTAPGAWIMLLANVKITNIPVGSTANLSMFPSITTEENLSHILYLYSMQLQQNP